MEAVKVINFSGNLAQWMLPLSQSAVKTVTARDQGDGDN